MPRNDESDSSSVRSPDDPRRSLKALQQETELELGCSEARDTGGVEHQSRDDREGVPGERREGKATASDASDRPAAEDASEDRGAERHAPGRPAPPRR